MSRLARLRTLQWLTVLVPAVCAGLYETVRHSLLASALPLGLGTAVAVALVIGLSFLFARVSFGIIRGMEADLVARNRELQALNRRVERLAVIEERDRLAREMHDSVAQVLAYLLVRLDTIDGLLERGRTGDASGEIGRLRVSAEQAYADVREAITGLRTRPDDGPLGLAAALRGHVTQFAERTGVQATFSAAGIEGSADAVAALSPAAELQIMRIAQEALANVRKHARAGHVDVRFWHDDAGWHITVVDDGIGFDPAAPASPGRQHFGLPIMRERAQSLGGHLRVHSRRGAGTSVGATVPDSAPGPSAVDGPVLPAIVAGAEQAPPAAPATAVGGDAPPASIARGGA